MAKIKLRNNEEPVVDVVCKLSDSRYADGKLEEVQESLNNTRYILARLIDAIADKDLFSEEELSKIIRGW